MRRGIKDRQAAKDALLKRTRESYERKDESGRFGSYFKNVEDLVLWKCNEGKHEIDIIPFIAGDNMPVKMNIKPGDTAFMLDVYIHQNIGVNEDSVVCPAVNYNRPCPICEHRKQLRSEDADDDLVDSLRAKRRNVFNVICYDSDKEEDKGVQVYEVAHFFMGKHLAPLAEAPRGGGFIAYAHPDKELGKTVCFERKGAGKENTSFLAHRFLDRDYDISDEILGQAFCLDELLDTKTYEELYDVYWAGVGEPKDEEPVSSTEGRSSTRQRRASSDDNSCPAGGSFGVDIDKLEECSACDEAIWDSCAKEFDRLEELVRGKKEEEGPPEPPPIEEETPPSLTRRERGEQSDAPSHSRAGRGESRRGSTTTKQEERSQTPLRRRERTR